MGRQTEGWRSSSVHDYRGMLSAAEMPRGTLLIDRVELPADEHARI
ncbi:MAG: hypothetical protein ABSC21_00800 [Terriglobia bacterium]